MPPCNCSGSPLTPIALLILLAYSLALLLLLLVLSYVLLPCARVPAEGGCGFDPDFIAFICLSYLVFTAIYLVPFIVIRLTGVCIP